MNTLLLWLENGLWLRGDVRFHLEARKFPIYILVLMKESDVCAVV